MVSDPCSVTEGDNLSRGKGARHTSSPNGQWEGEIPGHNRDHVLDRTQQEHVTVVVVAVCNHNLVPVGAAPDEGGRPCDSHAHALLLGEEDSDHDREAGDDIPLHSPISMEVDASHVRRGGSCNQWHDTLSGLLLYL